MLALALNSFAISAADTPASPPVIIYTEEPASTKPIKRTLPHKFTSDDDNALQDAVTKFGKDNWTKVAKAVPGKTSRQCKERFKSLYENVGFQKWTLEEDTNLKKKYDELGPNWHKIQIFFPNRTINAIKARLKKLIGNFTEQANDEERKTNQRPPSKAESFVIPNIQTTETQATNIVTHEETPSQATQGTIIFEQKLQLINGMIYFMSLSK